MLRAPVPHAPYFDGIGLKAAIRRIARVIGRLDGVDGVRDGIGARSDRLQRREPDRARGCAQAQPLLFAHDS